MLMSREDISRNTKNKTWTVPVHNKQTLKNESSFELHP